ncbi:MAG TPA: D-2-hydroxyacid dehydrogenase family protein [Candidatus Binatia bacterium]|jgi:phosphoglycerate dehydrogenase-like enzyme
MRAVVLEDYLNYAVTAPCMQPLRERCEVVVYDKPAASEDENVERMAGAAIVIPVRNRVSFTESLLSRIRHVKLTSQTGPWLSHIDLRAAAKLGIAVARCPDDGDDVVKTGTAEQTWNLILALMRDTELNQKTMRAGGWQVRAGHGLAGKTLGILGPGKIGGRVARVGLAFEMRVIGWSRTLDKERAAAIGIEAVSLDGLLAESDVISIHIPLTDTTRGFIGAREFGLMKPMAIVVITSRGGVIEEKALIEALRAGRIAGAGFDVYSQEPLPKDHPLRALPNVVMQPHIGGYTEEGYYWKFAPAVENAIAFLDGRPQNLVGEKDIARQLSRQATYLT